MAGKTIVVGISGASGAVYAQRLLQLLDADERVEHIILVASSGGLRLLRHELNIGARELAQLPATLLGRESKKVEAIPVGDIGASIASGSYPTDGMVVIPCSMGTLGAIAGGISDNLLRRAADVHLKEGRPLLLCWRDTPLNTSCGWRTPAASTSPSRPATTTAPRSSTTWSRSSAAGCWRVWACRKKSSSSGRVRRPRITRPTCSGQADAHRYTRIEKASSGAEAPYTC
jgi:4-hydroxy-3-polyprenylbenzoate decarboxylase